MPATSTFETPRREWFEGNGSNVKGPRALNALLTNPDLTDAIFGRVVAPMTRWGLNDYEERVLISNISSLLPPSYDVKEPTPQSTFFTGKLLALAVAGTFGEAIKTAEQASKVIETPPPVDGAVPITSLLFSAALTHHERGDSAVGMKLIDLFAFTKGSGLCQVEKIDEVKFG